MIDRQRVRIGRKFAQVSEGAKEIFLRDGFSGTSVDDIAAAARVSKATLYSYFADKRLMFEEAMQNERQRLEDAILFDIPADAAPAQAIPALTRQIAEWLVAPDSVRLYRVHVAEAARFPDVQAQLVLTDAPANLVEDGFDLQIKFGEPTATRNVMALLLRNRRVLIASPEYLRAHGRPKRLSDLEDHACIALRQEHAAYDVWRFGDDDSVRIRSGLSTNDGEIAVSWVLGGHGIMLRSEWDIARHVRAGRLEVVLPRHAMRADIFAVYPERLNLSAKVRMFIDILRDRIREQSSRLQLP